MSPFMGAAFVVLATAYSTTRFSLLVRFKWVGCDTYYHLILGGLIRERGVKHLINDRFVIPELVNYPPLFPRLVSLMPARRLQLLQYSAPLVDAITLCGVVIAAWRWWGLPAGLIAALVYVTTPYTFDIAYSLNPRPIANLFLSFALIALGWDNQPAVAAVVAASVLSAGVLLSHRLTAQSLLACLIVYGVFHPEAAIAVAGLAPALAIALSGGYYVHSFRGHAAALRTMAASSISPTYWAQNVSRILRGNPHLVTVVAVTALVGESVGTRGGLVLAFTSALLIVAVVFPFGEGDRHFASASSSVALFLAGTATTPLGMSALACTVTLGFAVILMKNLVYPRLAAGGSSTIVTQTLRDACDQIRWAWRLPGRPLVLVWPQSLSYQVMYFANARVHVASGGTGSGLRYNRQFEARLIRDGLVGLRQDEQPDFLLAVGSASNTMEVPDMLWTRVFQRDDVTAYRRNEPRSPNEATVEESDPVGSARAVTTLPREPDPFSGPSAARNPRSMAGTWRSEQSRVDA
ncbi:MAG: hypothetical protein ACR2JC_18485 [Chloroflexota bacterium]